MNAPLETVPEGASCGQHDADASFLCTRCGDFGCPECLFATVKDRSVCTTCAAKGLGEAIPWERRKELGNVRAFWQTLKLVTFSPTRFFRTPTTHEGVIAAVMHGVLSVTLGLFLAYLLAGVMMTAAGGAVAALGDERLGPLGVILGGYGCTILGLSPILAVMAGPANALFGQVMAAAAAHGTLALTKKATASFEETLRVCSYSNAPFFFSFIPLLGSFSWFWVVGIEVIGLRETHRCGTDSAAFAAIAYRVALFVVLVGGYAVVLFGLFAFATPPGAPPPAY